MRLFLFLILVFPALELAQDSIDPNATIILDKISNNLNETERIELSFDLVIKFPGAEADIKEGTLVQDNDKFKIAVGEQTILSNGKDLYMINHPMKSAQLSEASAMDESQGMMNPKQMLTMYDSGEYFYAITGEEDIEGVRVLNIEFKPKDRYAEFSKMRMAVNKKTNEPVYLKLFNKDGSQFIIEINDINLSPSIKKGTFEFSKTTYPGIVVEDLRID